MENHPALWAPLLGKEGNWSDGVMGNGVVEWWSNGVMENHPALWAPSLTHPVALRHPFPMLRPGHSAQEGIRRGTELTDIEYRPKFSGRYANTEYRMSINDLRFKKLINRISKIDIPYS